MKEKKSGGAQRAPARKRKSAGTSQRKSSSVGATPEKLKKHSTARKLSAVEKKRKMRIQRIKKAAVLIAVLFGILALFFALRTCVFAPQEIETERESLPASAETEQQAEPAARERAQEQETPQRRAEPESHEGQEESAPPLPSTPPETAPEDEEFSALAVPEGTGTLCFVFDDAGHNLFHLEPFLNLPFPCTIAVLPSLPHSAECAERIRAAGKEVILHQPMQAVNLNIDPGPGAVMPGMTAEEIHAVVNANLDEIWPVSGLNNHEGSLITADAESMEAVFDVIEERSIFFLDSRTIAGTAAPEIAAERGMRILERAVFLDNSQDREEIRAAVLQGVKSASKNGHAVMIGHVWSEELAEILAELYPALTAAGYNVTDLSALLASLESEEARYSGNYR